MKKRRKGLLGLLLAGMLALTACGSGGTADTVVLKIDNHDITKYEYMVYLYTTTQSFVSAAGEDVWNLDFDGQTADELVEERTISTLQSVLAAKEYAAAHDIALTDDQKEEAAAAAKQFLSTVDADALKKMEVDEEKLVPLMEASYLYSLVYDSIASECAVDETDMAEQPFWSMMRKRQMRSQSALRMERILHPCSGNMTLTLRRRVARKTAKPRCIKAICFPISG